MMETQPLGEADDRLVIHLMLKKKNIVFSFGLTVGVY